MYQILFNGLGFSHQHYDAFLRDTRVQRRLVRAKTAGTETWCNCTLPNRRLLIRRLSDHCVVAAWPGDARLHNKACRFHSAEPGAVPSAGAPATKSPSHAVPPCSAREASAAPAITPTQTPASEQHDAGLAVPVRRQNDRSLQFGFLLEGKSKLKRMIERSIPGFLAALAEPAQDIAEDRAPKRVNEHQLSLLGLLQMLWSRARLNGWAASWTRDYWRVWRELNMVIQQEHTSKGQPLSDLLYIAPQFRREDADEINAKWMAFAQGISGNRNSVTRRLILGEVKDLDRGPLGFTVVLRHLATKLYLPKFVHTQLFRDFSRPLTAVGKEQPTQSRVMALLVIEIDAENRELFIVDGAFMLCSAAWIPTTSIHELALANALVASDRTFERPMVSHDEGERHPDFILRDTGRPTAMEVFSLDSMGYQERKFVKISRLRRQGFDLWAWRAASNDPMPELPPARPAA